MADHAPAGPLEMGAPMDYAEHNKTYSVFLAIVKWNVIVLVALMVAMAFGLVGSGGFFSSIILFAVLVGLGAWLLRGW